jgi:hypothetical protein
MQVPPSTLRYLDGIPLTGLQLAVVGKDPFPSNPVGIPFCKPTWDQQLAENCSGRHVLLSLGFDLSRVRSEYATPSLLFERLRAVGIVFLNASYIYVGTSIRKTKHLANLQNAYQLNKPILQAAKTVLYCGEASKIQWVTSINGEGRHCVVHPDVRNKVNPCTSDRWRSWWCKNALHDSLGLILPSTEHP